MGKDIKKWDKEYIAHTYNRFDLVLKEGKNATVKDFDGKEYVDFTSGIGVNSLGYCNSKWSKAISEQANTLNHVSNLYYSEPDVLLAKKLCERTHFKKVFFANSGAEANEGAIKVARKYSHDKYQKDRYEIITLVNSFHGRTITTLSATGQDVFHKYFTPFTEGFVYAKANDLEDVLSKINEKTCAVMMEMVQGEGGVISLDKDFVQAIDKVCKEKDIMFIVDEVQTGIGRCGTLFAYENFDIKPDIVSSAKGLGGGLPIGAVLMNETVENVFNFGDHGTTFGGNPIVCAGANVVLDTIDDKFLKEVNKKSEYIRNKIKTMKHVIDVSGLGLMIGIELDEKVNAKDIVVKCIEKGAIFLTAKTKVRLLPPLTISEDEINKGLKILEEVLESE